jgi:hypothetical protein
MPRHLSAALVTLTLAASPAFADSFSSRAAIGGGLGGALGAFVGSELEGRSGAVAGGALGAAAGAAIATDGQHRHRNERRVVYDVYPAPVEHHDHHYYADDYDDYRGHGHYYGHRGYFCPPGQAKKGRC